MYYMNNNSYAPGCNVYGFNMGGAAYAAPSPNFCQQPQGQQYVNPSVMMNAQNNFINQMMFAQQQIQQQNQMQGQVYTNPYMQNPNPVQGQVYSNPYMQTNVQIPNPVMNPSQVNGNMYYGYNQPPNPYTQYNNPYMIGGYQNNGAMSVQQRIYNNQMKWAREALKEREKSQMGAAYIHAITVRAAMRRAGYPDEVIEAEWKRLTETPLERAKRIQEEMEAEGKRMWDDLTIIRVEIYRNGKRVHTVIDDMTDEEIKVARYGNWRNLRNNVVFNFIGQVISVDAIPRPKPYISPEMQKKIDDYNNLSMYDYFKYYLYDEHQACLRMEKRIKKQDKLIGSFDRKEYTSEVLKRQNLASKYNDGLLKLTPENVEDVAYGMIELYMNQDNKVTEYDAKKRELKVLPKEVYEANMQREHEAKLMMLKAQGVDIRDKQVLEQLRREEEAESMSCNPTPEQAETSVRRRLGFYDAVLGKNNPFKGEGIVP